jgi:hypothetical protein
MGQRDATPADTACRLHPLTGRVPLRAETHSSDDEGAATAPRRAAWEPAVTRSRARVTLLILSLDAPFSRALSGQPCPAAPFVSPASVSGPGSNARLASLEWHQPRQYPPSARRRGHGLWPEPARRRPVRCRGGTRSSRQWPPLTRKLQGPRQTSRTTAWSRRTRVFRVPLTRWIDARVIPVRETARCTGVAPRPACDASLPQSRMRLPASAPRRRTSLGSSRSRARSTFRAQLADAGGGRSVSSVGHRLSEPAVVGLANDLQHSDTSHRTAQPVFDVATPPGQDVVPGHRSKWCLDDQAVARGTFQHGKSPRDTDHPKGCLCLTIREMARRSWISSGWALERSPVLSERSSQLESKGLS